MNATAFSKGLPFGARLNAIFSSDIGHFDVIDFCDPVPQAHELVEKGLITDDDFRAFTFENAVRLWARKTPASSRYGRRQGSRHRVERRPADASRGRINTPTSSLAGLSTNHLQRRSGRRAFRRPDWLKTFGLTSVPQPRRHGGCLGIQVIEHRGKLTCPPLTVQCPARGGLDPARFGVMLYLTSGRGRTR